jgi:hypothetical protein
MVKKSINSVKDRSIESNPNIRLKMEYLESAIFPPIDNKDHYHKEHKNKEEFATDTFNFKRFNILDLLHN